MSGSKRVRRMKNPYQRGALTLQALVSLSIFSIVVMSVTSLGLRQLAVTRQAAGHLGRTQLAQSTLAELQGDVYSVEAGSRTLEPVKIEGVEYERQLEIRAIEEDRALDVTLELRRADGKRTWTYRKVMLRL